MARVFLIASRYMGVLCMRELMSAGEQIVGVAAWLIKGYFQSIPLLGAVK